MVISSDDLKEGFEKGVEVCSFPRRLKCELLELSLDKTQNCPILKASFMFNHSSRFRLSG